MRIENGIIVGSNNKYETKNPLAKYLLRRFDQSISNVLYAVTPKKVLEIGCGEGHITELILEADRRLSSRQLSKILATDISVDLIKENAHRNTDSRVIFSTENLLTMKVEETFDLVVCCEVLEHINDPEQGVNALHSFGANDYLVSVPREPMWRALNFLRGAYVKDLGNSPGHINHFSRQGFIKLLREKFDIISVQSPIPWTVIHCKRK